MKDKIAEKVMELYEKGVKQAVIAETLNIPKWKVSRIVNKKPSSPSESEFTEEDYEAYEETVNGNAPDEDSTDDPASENPEIPGNSSEEDISAGSEDLPEDSSEEDNSAIPDDNPEDDFASENPETPGNPSDEGLPEQMRTIAEMTSAETARKMTESYKDVMDLMGSVTREIMENSVSGMDKATRMLLTASERLNAISERQEKQLAACSQNGNRADPDGNAFLYLLAALLLMFAAFSFGGICGTCDMLYLAVGLCGVLTTATVLLLVFYPSSGNRKTLLAFSISALAAAVPALISGYFFFLIEKSVMHLWLYALAGAPVGGIIGLLCIMRKNKKVLK